MATYSEDGQWLWNDETKEWIPAPPGNGNNAPQQVAALSPNNAHLASQSSDLWINFDSSVENKSIPSKFFQKNTIFAISATIIIIITSFFWLYSEDEVEEIEWDFLVVSSKTPQDNRFASITMFEGTDSEFKRGQPDYQNAAISISVLTGRGVMKSCDFDTAEDPSTGCEIKYTQNDIWVEGDTITLSSDSDLCGDESEECELTITIRINVNSDCSGNDCKTIPGYYEDYPMSLNYVIEHW
tara:strand:+ start:120 stop:842 length:723 start_codon:yes stop_codon:yes gene_type:complete